MNHQAVIIYHSFNDPIFKGLMLKYLKAYQTQESKPGDSFHVITLEQLTYEISEAEQAKIKEELRDHNIFWYPLQYHSGGAFLVFKKLWDLFLCLRTVMQIHKTNNLKSVIGFTSISGAISYILSKLIRVKCIALNIEPHSDFMIDFKIWKKSGLKYLILKFLEDKLVENGDHIAVPSRSGFSFWQKREKTGKLYFVPTCIDLNDFVAPTDSKEKVRMDVGLPLDKRVVLYLGKFGGIYYNIGEAAQIFRKLQDVNRDLFFYIITPDSLGDLKKELDLNGLKGSYLLKDKIPYEQIAAHIFSADFGIVLIPPYPNQQYRCPIKTANYLACGVPYIIHHNIGDDSELAIKENAGIVIDESNMTLHHLSHQGEFYRDIAKKYRDISLVVNFLRVALLEKND